MSCGGRGPPYEVRSCRAGRARRSGQVEAKRFRFHVAAGDFDTRLVAQLDAIARGEAETGRLVLREVAEPKPGAPIHLAWRHEHRGKGLDRLVERLQDEPLRRALPACRPLPLRPRRPASGGGGVRRYFFSSASRSSSR